jgi:peptide chain release factor 2
MRSGGIFDVDGLIARVAELETTAADPDLWQDPERARTLLRNKATLERSIRDWEHLSEGIEECETLLELGIEAEDPETLAEAGSLTETLTGTIRTAEVRAMLSEEADESSAVVEINSGAGGTDAADWAEMLKRMYTRWAERMGYQCKTLDEQRHEEAGIKGCTLQVQGAWAYGYLKAEIGVHRLVRISPFDANSRRHTAFASVHAYPNLDDDIEIEIRESDLRIDTFRSSGAGGQHVNTTDSAVRITHKPTGVVSSCQNERSQHKNRATAMKTLKAKLYQLELQQRQEERDAVNAEKKRIEWGSQIRSYVLQPYRLVKDNRTAREEGNVDRVLDGDLTPFMEAWLIQRTSNSHEESS